MKSTSYLRSLLIRLLDEKPRAVDPYGIDASLAARKAARPARQEAARRAAETRRAQA